MTPIEIEAEKYCKQYSLIIKDKESFMIGYKLGHADGQIKILNDANYRSYKD